MYEPLFGQNIAPTDPTKQLIPWLGKSITWVNGTAIDVVLRPNIYWENLTTDGPVKYRPITTKDVNYTFWLYGAFHSSPVWCYYMNGLRDRLENNGTDQDLSSFVIISDSEFVIRLNPVFANSDVAYRGITKNRPILPWDVWTQIMASADYADAPLTFANDWTGTVQAMPQAWMVASGMYLSWYFNPTIGDTIMKRNDLWWGQNDTDWGRLPYPKYIENYVFAGNDVIPDQVESGNIDWDGNYIAGLQDVMTSTFPNVHTYLWNLPYFPDGSALLIVPNHRMYPNGEPWLTKAITYCINYTAVSSVSSYYMAEPSVLLLGRDDGIANVLLNKTIEAKYTPGYNPAAGLALLNQYTFVGDGTQGTVNGQRYTKDGPTAEELALYPEYSSGDSKVVDALPQVAGVNVPIPTVGVGSSEWKLININGWTDVNAADAIVCYSVQTSLGINLVSTLLGSGWSTEYVDRMNYAMGNSSFDFADYCMEGALNNNLYERYTQFFTGAYEGTWNHYGSYRNPTLTALIYSLDTVPAGSQAQQNIANQIFEIVGSNLPLIPEGGHPNWYIYSDKYWIGFADQYSNPLMPAGPYIGSAQIAALQLGIWRLHPKNADLTGDAKVNISDIALIARAFGTTPGHARWITIADVNDDRKVDILDIATVARAWGQTYPPP
jgi:hypothetical protein